MIKDKYYIEFLEYLTGYIEENKLRLYLLEMQDSGGAITVELVKKYKKRYLEDWSIDLDKWGEE